MSAILNSLNAHNFLIFQPILMTLVSQFMVFIALSDKTYSSLGLQSPLRQVEGDSPSPKRGNISLCPRTIWIDYPINYT